ncbi:MAG: hypothetical protein WB439_14460 [Acidobacteriaceae bacterium]
MKRLLYVRVLSALFLASLFLSTPTLAPAQETGYWRAASHTAKSITGDVALTGEKISINFSTYWIAQIRSLTPAELGAAFGADTNTPNGSGNLYRLSIPGDKRLLHKNTLCGGEDIQWLATYSTGRTLQLAFFSTSHMPVLTPEALNNATNLCGVFEYQR